MNVHWMISYKTCVVSKVSKRVFPCYIWILIIYCSFIKRGIKLGELWCLMTFLTIFQLYHGYLVFIGGVYWENHRPASSLINFIHNVSSNKGVLTAGIYIHTTVYINLKNNPPSKPEYIIRNKTPKESSLVLWHKSGTQLRWRL